jgi:hypothetical protein
MPEPKTRPTKERVTAFLKRATEGDRRKDSAAIVRMLQKASGAKGEMWGRGIVGFGRVDIAYAGGRTADWPIIAFARAQAGSTIYINRRLDGLDTLLDSLGKQQSVGGCLHIKRLSDVDVTVLARLLLDPSKRRRRLAVRVTLPPDCRAAVAPRPRFPLRDSIRSAQH